MRYHALATDYDGTIAYEGHVNERTIAALEDVRQSGRKLIMVTGRELDELMDVFPRLDMFDRVVAENGALLYRPATKEERLLVEPPPPEFARELIKRGAERVSCGRVIVATWVPHETAAIETIREMGLELQVIFNKGAVMVLPSGVNKATGLMAALHELGLSPHNVVGIGDAENDHAFLNLCECSVAVSNALETLKERVDWVMKESHGEGAVEMMHALLGVDLSNVPERGRHMLRLGLKNDGSEALMSPYGVNVLIAGTSGGGKSTMATAFLERLGELGYQFIVIDPEGDYSTFEGAVVLGDNQHAPSVQEVMDLVSQPDTSAAVNLIGLALNERPKFFETLMPRIQELRARTGRPHWVLVDEAHHVLPSSWDASGVSAAKDLNGMVFVTLEPDRMSPSILGAVDVVLGIGEGPEETLANFAKATDEKVPELGDVKLNPGEAMAWFRRAGEQPFWLRTEPPKAERKRHRRKYAEGELKPDLCFYFKGPEGKLNLKAQNLSMFVQIAEGVDDETWLHHLKNGDIAGWFLNVIKDPDLAASAKRLQEAGTTAAESRKRIRTELEHRYILAA